MKNIKQLGAWLKKRIRLVALVLFVLILVILQLTVATPWSGVTLTIVNASTDDSICRISTVPVGSELTPHTRRHTVRSIMDMPPGADEIYGIVPGNYDITLFDCSEGRVLQAWSNVDISSSVTLTYSP